MMELNESQRQWLLNHNQNEDPIYMYKSYEGKNVYLYKRIGTASVHLTNRLRSLNEKGYISYNPYDTLKVDFKTHSFEPVIALGCIFKEVK